MTGGQDPCLSVRRQPAPSSDIRVADQDINLTDTTLHATLLDAGLAAPLLDALEDIPGDHLAEREQVLLDAGVDALDGLFATVAAKAASLTADLPDDPSDRLQEYVERTQQQFVDASRLGRGTPLGYRSTRDDLGRGPLMLLRLADTTPTIEITLTAEFASRRPEHRRDVLTYLSELGLACRVNLVLTGTARRCIREMHRADVPPHVTQACDPRTEPQARKKEEALAVLDPTGTPAAVLRALSDSPTGSLSYTDLCRELRLEATDESLVRQTARRLEERHGLAERIERPDGTTVVSLLPPGEAVVQELEADEQICRRATSSRPIDDSRDITPKILPPCRVTPPAKEGCGEDQADKPGRDSRESSIGRDDGGSATARPDDEAAAVTTEPGHTNGWVDVEHMPVHRHAAVVGSAPDGAIGLIDAPFDRDDDGRRPWWSYDADRDVLVVGAEYHNPMQLWVALARSLASHKTFSKILTPERLGGENLDGLETSDRELLRDARCIGWLRDDATTAEFLDELAEAREELLAMTTDHKAETYDDRDEHRGEILRYALGLAGTVVHLLDLAGVDVVREVRVPEFGRHFSRDERRADLARTIATGAAIQSRCGHYAAWRQLFEEREEKRSAAKTPNGLNGSMGSLIGSFVVAGDGVTDLEDCLETYLHGPRELHPDAPEIGVSIGIEKSCRSATARAVRRVLTPKRIRPTPESIDVLHGFVSDPYAAAEAVNRALEREDHPRRMRLDEVRRALSFVDASRLLPEATPAVRQGVAALFDAERPISQAELCRRAEISTQSWRNHRERLIDLGLVCEVEEGWRACLPFSSEREQDVDEVLPWILVEDPGRGVGLRRSNRHPTDVLMELVFEIGAPVEGAIEEFAFSGQWPPDPAAVDGTLEGLGLWPYWEMICAGCGVDPPPTEVLMGATGADLDQTPLPIA